MLDTPQRYTMYPIVHDDLWQCYKKQMACFWTPEEVDFSKDREQWNAKLNDNERAFLKGVLAFFAASDSVVSLNIMNNFCKEVPVIEAQAVYTYQAMMENIHAEVYSIMIDTYIQDPDEKRGMFEHLGEMSSVKKKVDWASKWSKGVDGGGGGDEDGETSADSSFATRLLAFVIVEGLFFSGAFCAIYWIKQRNLLPGLTKSNEFIARDEGQHTEFGCILYNKLKHKRLPQDDAHAMFRDAIAIENEFINESIPCRMIGMNAELMTQYIEYVADGILMTLGYEPLFGSANPFGFMELIGLPGRSNFFEERVSLYQRADAMGASTDTLYVEEF